MIKYLLILGKLPSAYFVIRIEAIRKMMMDMRRQTNGKKQSPSYISEESAKWYAWKNLFLIKLNNGIMSICTGELGRGRLFNPPMNFVRTLMTVGLVMFIMLFELFKT